MFDPVLLGISFTAAGCSLAAIFISLGARRRSRRLARRGFGRNPNGPGTTPPWPTPRRDGETPDLADVIRRGQERVVRTTGYQPRTGSAAPARRPRGGSGGTPPAPTVVHTDNLALGILLGLSMYDSDSGGSNPDGASSGGDSGGSSD